VALRPAGLEPLDVQRQVYEAFGGRSGQWVVLVADRERERAHERADRITERLGSMPGDVDAIDSLSTLVPSAPTQRARLRARDALDLPARARELEQALGAEQFAPERFERVLEGMRHPPNEVLALDALAEGDGAIMLSRYLGQDGGDALLVLYVLPHPGHEDRVEAAIREVDAAASITGYGRLESSLKDALQRDLPRIGLVAGALVLLALMLALRRARDVALAAAVVVTELGVVLFAIERLDVPLHAYDALVLPVLLGITVDEAMFLLHRARAVRGVEVVRETLRREGPLVATTALTTAAGFGALLLCDFDGLRHLGMVGAIGSIAGLLIALVLLPAGLRLTGGRVR
jgi:predicted exporter